MDDPFFNLDDWYQIVLLLIVFGGWILRAIFQAFGKATGRRPAQPNRPEAAPGKGLREFLQEIRDEAERQQRGGRQAQEVVAQEQERAGEEDLQWEQVADEAGEREAALAARREELRRRAEERRQSREADEAQRRQEAALEQEELQTVADRRIDSALTDRHVESKVAGRSLESQLAERHLPALRSRFARRRSGGGRSSDVERTLPGALDGLNMQQLILAQVILGPPKSKNPHRPGNF